MVPRGGIEPPTLRFSVFVLGAAVGARKFRKLFCFNDVGEFTVAPFGRTFRNVPRIFVHDYTGFARADRSIPESQSPASNRAILRCQELCDPSWSATRSVVY
jgi:hypothetical protein